MLLLGSLWKKCLTRTKCDSKPVRFRSTGISAFPPFAARTSRFEKFALSDAPALLAMLTSEEVAEFVSPLPRTVEGFEGFIAEAHHERTRGNSFCFGIVPDGYDDAMGLFQVRQLEPGFGSAEWGFAIGSPFWGRGVFVEGAKAVIDFSFGVVGVHRLEARSIASNGRGNAALRKVGALQEGILRRSFQRNGRYFDQILWSILKDDWRQAKAVWGPKFH